MSQEILQIIQKLNMEKFELQLVLQCAPVLSGKKISNLFITSEDDAKVLEQFLKRTGFYFYRFFYANHKVTYLIFRRKELEEYLLSDEVVQILKLCGYTNISLGFVLRRFQIRYQEYMLHQIDFPHEMGLILGYPVEDVRGFIENNGQNYLYSGYWKVYENLKEKLELFKSYEAVMNEQVYMLKSGMTLEEIICAENNRSMTFVRKDVKFARV